MTNSEHLVLYVFAFALVMSSLTVLPWWATTVLFLLLLHFFNATAAALRNTCLRQLSARTGLQGILADLVDDGVEGLILSYGGESWSESESGCGPCSGSADGGPARLRRSEGLLRGPGLDQSKRQARAKADR